LLKIKGQLRSDETGMIFMPPEGPSPGGSPSMSCKVSRKPVESSASGDGWGAEGINRSAQSGRSSLGAL